MTRGSSRDSGTIAKAMRARRGLKSSRHTGYALISMLALLATFSMVYIGKGLRASDRQTDVRTQRETLRALHEARTALIAYAAMENNTPGTMPCPAPDVNGNSVGMCTNGTSPVTLGRIPWNRLGMIAPRDGDGQCLWYALSLTHRNLPGYTTRGASTDTPAVNTATLGALSLQQGAIVHAGLVAVLIAPGLPMTPAQALGRTSGTRTVDCTAGLQGAFMETPNADGDASFSNYDIALGVNDVTTSIDPLQLMRPVLRRALAPFASLSQIDRDILKARIDALPAETGTLKDLRENSAPTTPQSFDALLNTSATSTGVQCPTNVPIDPVGWLCVNKWYERIQYTKSTHILMLRLDNAAATGYRCSLSLSDGQLQCGVS
jgi:hypothetical protein